MYFDRGGGRAPPPQWQPPRGSRVTKKQERAILWLVGLNALLLLIAPIGGATIVQAILALWSR